jgi:hypothetical protein
MYLNTMVDMGLSEDEDEGLTSSSDVFHVFR